jgi:hypothetical protein
MGSRKLSTRPLCKEPDCLEDKHAPITTWSLVRDVISRSVNLSEQLHDLQAALEGTDEARGPVADDNTPGFGLNAGLEKTVAALTQASAVLRSISKYLGANV